MNRWKRSSACLRVPVAAAGSGIADKTGEKCFSSSLLVRKWGHTLLELWEFMVSGNLLEYFLLLTASPVDDGNSLFCFSVAAIVVVKYPIKEMAVPSYQPTLPLWPASTCVWGQGQGRVTRITVPSRENAPAEWKLEADVSGARFLLQRDIGPKLWLPLFVMFCVVWSQRMYNRDG